MKCIVCDKQLSWAISEPPEFLDNHGWQPSDGTAFRTYGHYGSTFFDEMNGTFIEAVVCDDCLRKKNSREYIIGTGSREAG